MPRISQLPSKTVPASGDELAIVEVATSTTKKITRADLLKGADLPNDTVTTGAIKDGAVTTDKIADSNVTTAKIANKAVTLPKINGGTTAGVLTTDASGNVSTNGNYSTSEVNTNTTWIDGKTIYQITLNFGTLPNNSSKNVQMPIGTTKVILFSGYSYAPDIVTIVPIPFLHTSSVSSQITCSYTPSTRNLSVTTGSDRTAFTETYLTVRYIK